MNNYSLSHLSDDALLTSLGVVVVKQRASTVVLLAHLAEVDARRLYLPAACSSMYEYCMREMHFSEDEAVSRIRAARMARSFPGVYEAVADGRLSLTTLGLLQKYLTPENATELLKAAANKTCLEVKELLARLSPQPDVPSRVEPVMPRAEASQGIVACEQGFAPDLKRVDMTVERAKVQPLSPETYSIQCTISREDYELLRYAQTLMGHTVPAGDLATVLGQALRALVQNLEKTKFGATSRPRASRGGSNAASRYVPVSVKRTVWERDGGQCAFVGSNGQRCQAGSPLEFDHVEAYARGGEATVDGMRLLCRAHNQFAAEQAFGKSFMYSKREVARLEAEERRSVAAEKHLGVAQTHASAADPDPPELDVTPYLRKLGFRKDESRRLAECSAVRAETTLEARVRAALRNMESGRYATRGP